jgi:hypothetical protein
MTDEQEKNLWERLTSLETRLIELSTSTADQHRTFNANYIDLCRDLKDEFKKLGERPPASVEAVKTPRVPAAKAAPVAVPGAKPCPEHPRAVQTANGCSAEGCTVGPS